jgi:hypothetical protein
MGMLSLRIKGSRSMDPQTDPSRIAQGSGLYPWGTLARTLRSRDQAEPEQVRRLCSRLRGSPEP